MPLRYREFDRIRSVLEARDAEEPLTAREILRLLERHGEDFESAHRVATILGRRARDGHVEIIDDQPYRYRIPDQHT
jgi:hypothetical protein